MSKLIGLATLAAVVAIAPAGRASTWLACKGHIDGPTVGAITHYVELRGEMAAWDGADYAVALTGPHYQLSWPASKPRPANRPASVMINRADGGYYAAFGAEHPGWTDGSTPDDPGCEAIELKF